ncbi:F-box/RNI-like superfamily protein [Rhynchospora pubera]|uniref:F-box/RNI-like superfamily protein n=1 Tax=Rhynchospora pubera TaxID=906938 RepID=A0AAV8D0J8_9POAL|nr:F-box/RNI-like superfamily protein [Rhynchospora pubera]
MENSNKVPQLSRNDMLSHLPAEILLVILSLLPRSDAAVMRCLSRTWRKLYDSVFLSFFCDEFDRLGKKEYMRHVKTTLRRRKEKGLESFQVIWLHKKSDAWLHYAVHNDAKSIHVIYLRDAWEQHILPDRLLYSGSLEELAIYSYSRKPELAVCDMHLRSLRRLIILSLTIDGDFSYLVSRRCPVLKELYFVSCKLEFKELASKSLRNLTIERCCVGTEYTEGSVTINTPNLQHLHYNAVWPDYLRKKQDRLEYVYDIWTKLDVEIPELKTLTLGGLWLTGTIHAVDYFLQKTGSLEHLTFLCNSRAIVSEDISFPCPEDLYSSDLKIKG